MKDLVESAKKVIKSYLIKRYAKEDDGIFSLNDSDIRVMLHVSMGNAEKIFFSAESPVAELFEVDVTQERDGAQQYFIKVYEVTDFAKVKSFSLFKANNG